MKPLKVTFHLKTPLALAHPWIHFDSLLIHAVLKKQLGGDFYSLPSKTPVKKIADKIRMPPPRVAIGKYHDVYRASVSLINDEAAIPQPFIFSYRKRSEFPLGGRGKISLGSGYFKLYNLKISYIPAEKVSFYVYADYTWLKNTVNMIHTLGKETNIGFGFIKETVIEETEEDYSLVKDGLAMRPIPVRYVHEYEDACPLAYKPPYWDKDSIGLCVTPFTRVKL